MVHPKLKTASQCVWNWIRHKGVKLRKAGVKLFKAGEIISYWATIIAALVAVLTFYFGYQQFRQTQEATRDNLALQRLSLDLDRQTQQATIETLNLQKENLELDRESKAVELYVKYNEMMRDRESSPRPGESEFWRSNLFLSIIEAIFNLTRHDKEWQETVRWMLGNHVDFLKNNNLDCSTYDGEFIAFVNQQVGENVCTPQNTNNPGR